MFGFQLEQGFVPQGVLLQIPVADRVGRNEGDAGIAQQCA